MSKDQIITGDPDLHVAKLLAALAIAIRHTTGRDPEIIIWPKGIPLHGLPPGEAGTWSGVKITAPRMAIDAIERWRA